MAVVPAPMDWSDGVVYVDTDYNREIRDAVNFLLRPPMFMGRNTTATALTTSAWTAIPLQTEDLNTEGAGMHSTTTNPSRVTITHTGWWDIVAQSSWTATTNANANRRIIDIRKNGTQFLRGRQDMEPALAASDQWVKGPIMARVYFVAGDYIELVQYHDSGSATMTTWAVADAYPFLGAAWRANG